jgi:hypothetical protein
MERVTEDYLTCTRLSRDYKKKHREFLEIYFTLCKTVILLQQRGGESDLVDYLINLIMKTKILTSEELNALQRVQQQTFEQVKAINREVDEEFFSGKNSLWEQMPEEQKMTFRQDRETRDESLYERAKSFDLLSPVNIGKEKHLIEYFSGYDYKSDSDMTKFFGTGEIIKHEDIKRFVHYLISSRTHTPRTISLPETFDFFDEPCPEWRLHSSPPHLFLKNSGLLSITNLRYGSEALSPPNHFETFENYERFASENTTKVHASVEIGRQTEKDIELTLKLKLSGEHFRPEREDVVNLAFFEGTEGVSKTYYFARGFVTNVAEEETKGEGPPLQEETKTAETNYRQHPYGMGGAYAGITLSVIITKTEWDNCLEPYSNVSTLKECFIHKINEDEDFQQYEAILSHPSVETHLDAECHHRLIANKKVLIGTLGDVLRDEWPDTLESFNQAVGCVRNVDIMLQKFSECYTTTNTNINADDRRDEFMQCMQHRALLHMNMVDVKNSICESPLLRNEEMSDLISVHRNRDYERLGNGVMNDCFIRLIVPHYKQIEREGYGGKESAAKEWKKDGVEKENIATNFTYLLSLYLYIYKSQNINNKLYVPVQEEFYSENPSNIDISEWIEIQDPDTWMKAVLPISKENDDLGRSLRLYARKFLKETFVKGVNNMCKILRQTLSPRADPIVACLEGAWKMDIRNLSEEAMRAIAVAFLTGGSGQKNKDAPWSSPHGLFNQDDLCEQWENILECCSKLCELRDEERESEYPAETPEPEEEEEEEEELTQETAKELLKGYGFFAKDETKSSKNEEEEPAAAQQTHHEVGDESAANVVVRGGGGGGDYQKVSFEAWKSSFSGCGRDGPLFLLKNHIPTRVIITLREYLSIQNYKTISKGRVEEIVKILRDHRDNNTLELLRRNLNVKDLGNLPEEGQIISVSDLLCGPPPPPVCAILIVSMRLFNELYRNKQEENEILKKFIEKQLSYIKHPTHLIHAVKTWESVVETGTQEEAARIIQELTHHFQQLNKHTLQDWKPMVKYACAYLFDYNEYEVIYERVLPGFQNQEETL